MPYLSFQSREGKERIMIDAALYVEADDSGVRTYHVVPNGEKSIPHFALIPHGSGLYLYIILYTTYPIRINGALVCAMQVLHDKDEIQIGEKQFVYSQQRPDYATSQEAEVVNEEIETF